MLTFLLVVIAVYVVLCAVMWNFQRSLLYLPDRNMGPPSHYGLAGFSAVRVPAEDGTRLTLWHHAARDGFPTVLYFTGNGGHLGYRAETFAALAQAGYGVLALSYRGYGTSEGTPHEEGLYQDARATLHHGQTALGLTPDQLIYFGESLGTGVAIQLATETTPKAVVLQAPYTSIVDRAQELYPWLPVALLATDRYESLAKLRDVHAPVLVFHGERDTIIPVSHGRAILAAANEPKHGVFFPDVNHNDFDVAVLVRELDQFLARYTRAAGPSQP